MIKALEGGMHQFVAYAVMIAIAISCIVGGAVAGLLSLIGVTQGTSTMMALLFIMVGAYSLPYLGRQFWPLYRLMKVRRFLRDLPDGWVAQLRGNDTLMYSRVGLGSDLIWTEVMPSDPERPISDVTQFMFRGNSLSVEQLVVEGLGPSYEVLYERTGVESDFQLRRLLYVLRTVTKQPATTAS